MAGFFGRNKLPLLLLFVQIIFLVFFGLFARYPGQPKSKATTVAASTTTRDPSNVDPTTTPAKETTMADNSEAEVATDLGLYPAFQDVNVMIFIGFGFLMTFLKRYGFSAVGLNFLISVVCIQWATIVRGILHIISQEETREWENMYFDVNVNGMLTANFATATVLITFGALLGKTSPVQLVVIALVEVVISQVNEHFVIAYFQVNDAGESMFVHVFGAYFGIACARALHRDSYYEHQKEGSVYHSDLFAMVGTVFLWIFWPSFNGGAQTGFAQERAFTNTFYSLASCTVAAFLTSWLLAKKFDMVHIQNSTLAGGVAIGTAAAMMVTPAGALVVGAIAGVISVIGYVYMTPFLNSKGFHDTCGVNNLHGMPGLLAGVVGAVVAALTTKDTYAEGELGTIFEAMAGETARAANVQGGYQIAALAVCLLVAIISGFAVGLIVRTGPFDPVHGQSAFDDALNWETSPFLPEGQLVARSVVKHDDEEDIEMQEKEGERLTLTAA